MLKWLGWLLDTTLAAEVGAAMAAGPGASRSTRWLEEIQGRTTSAWRVGHVHSHPLMGWGVVDDHKADALATELVSGAAATIVDVWRSRISAKTRAQRYAPGLWCERGDI